MILKCDAEVLEFFERVGAGPRQSVWDENTLALRLRYVVFSQRKHDQGPFPTAHLDLHGFYRDVPAWPRAGDGRQRRFPQALPRPCGRSRPQVRRDSDAPRGLSEHAARHRAGRGLLGATGGPGLCSEAVRHRARPLGRRSPRAGTS
jgi:hypothetical protein